MNIMSRRRMQRVSYLMYTGACMRRYCARMSSVSGGSYFDDSVFDAKEFCNTFYPSVEGSQNFAGGYNFRWEQLYKFFTKYNSKWDNKTARLLEFGGGLVVTPLISAAPYVNQITFSAFLESERKEVELWKQGKEGARDWSSHFKYVVNDMEHISGDDAWREREELLRKRIANIVPCDALNDNPLLGTQEPFEIISTSSTLETACTSYVEYKAAIKRLVGLLKPGGFFLMLIPERVTFYVLGNKKWPCLHVTLEQVKEALAEAGTAVLMSERDPVSMEQMQNPVVVDKKSYAFVATHKVEF